MTEQGQTTKGKPTTFDVRRHGLIILLVLVLLAFVIILFIQKSREVDTTVESFDPKAVATDIQIDDALEKIYTRSGEIVELEDDYMVISSQAVRNGTVYEQRFMILVTDTTEYQERHLAFGETELTTAGMTASELTLGDTINATSSENIVNQDVFTATRIERYSIEEES
ncbi:MAG: hypothetical protein WCV86_04195 [Patescibacteria group bacterium]|jgi:hypothetical protein